MQMKMHNKHGKNLKMQKTRRKNIKKVYRTFINLKDMLELTNKEQVQIDK